MTRAQAAEAMAEALRIAAAELALAPCRDNAQHTHCEKCRAFNMACAALAAYGASAEQGTAWRREAPEPMAAYECRWWWVRFVLPNGRVSWCEPRDLGAPTECDLYCSRKPARGHFEFKPCRVDDAAPLPAGDVVETARVDGMRIVRNALLRECMSTMAKHAACFVVEREMKRIDPNCDRSLPEDMRALTAGTPGKETAKP